MTGLSDFLSMVEALVAAVEFDDGGMMVGQERVGGNGGLLSNDTLKKASTVRLTLGALKQGLAGPGSGNPAAREAVIEVMVAC